MHYYDVLASMKISRHRPHQRKRLGQTIRSRRTELLLSQEQLAELAGCHRNYVGKVERGEQNITIDMLVQIAKALKTTVAQLTRHAGV